ncbi:MAG: hypothetical protein IPL73_26585 [Candidatus Obscuribacter sp.]|nr:hypothetical protein [Candidatus Obscuribacter sp.]
MTLRTYSQVLRKLKKDSEADNVDATLKKLDDEDLASTTRRPTKLIVTVSMWCPKKIKQ